MKKMFFSLTALVGITLVQAQTKQDTAVGEVVTVTATKTERKQSETGKVVTVIDKETIDRNAGKTLGQLLNNQAGLTIVGAQNNLGSNQSVFMRGASTGRTLILLDGVPVSDPSLITNDFDLNLFSLNNIESIEICRGAQSTLYGSDAVAGVINIVTNKKGIEKAFNASGTLSYGSFNTLKANAQVFGKVDKFTYTVRAANVTTNGFSAAYDSTGTKGFDNDKYNGTVVNANVKYAFTDAFSIKAFAQNSAYKTSIDAGIFNDEKDFTVKNNMVIAGTGFEFKKNATHIVGNYQYSDINRNFYNDSIDRPGFSKFVTDDYFGKNQFVELYSSTNLGKGFSLLQGADYRYSNMNSQYFSLSSFGPFATRTKDSVQSQVSAYASFFYTNKNKKFNAELGGRMNVHSRYGNNATYTFNPSYAFTNKVRVFGTIATGFKAPTLYQLYSNFGNLLLNPEESKNYELGTQYVDKKFGARAVYFSRKINNAIDFNNITNRYFNIVKQNVSGLELELNAKPTEKLSITANYTYLKTAEIGQSRVTFKDTTYTHLLRRPNHSLNSTIAYQFTEKLYANVNLKAVGARYDVGGYKKADIKLDSYFLLGAYAEYKFNQKFKAFLDLQNITNTKFFDIRGFNSIPTVINGGVHFNF